jgi:hypothetical protein
MKLKTFIAATPILVCLFVLCPAAGAQEVDCTVQVNYEAVPTTNKDLLRDFADDIKSYLSNYNWGGQNTTDKVRCAMNIFIQGVAGDNRYTAQVFIGSQRQIYKSEQSTAVVRLFDDVWEFTYLRTRPITHNAYDFDDLASFLDFYMYVIMGYDYDTFDKLTGSTYFQKAADIARLGQSKGLKGWQPTTGTYSRLQLIQEILNPKFQPVREASWVYHFTGLDSLSLDKERAYTNIIKALSIIGSVKKQVDPRNIFIRSWFEAKYQELGALFADYPDQTIYITLSNIDPYHQKTYEEYRTKKR